MASKLKDTESIEKIIREMTVEEKAACVTGNSSFYSRAMEKYGIPKLLLLDGGTGFNSNEYYLDKAFQAYAKRKAAEGTPLNEEDFTGRMGGLEVVLSDKEAWENRTDSAKDEIGQDQNIGCYPSGMLMGATWNPDVIEACGHALGNEANVRGVDVLLGTPNVNIHRDPLNGRLFEGYSEDPCLVSKLAPSFVKGIQDEGVAADVKHFAANNQETDRMGVNEHIPERALREIYLPGFQACVQAGCKTVMSAYNKINGAACAQNRHLLHDILRDEWGFKGCVVSDWSAAYDQAQAAAAGNDLVMPGPRQLSPVVNAVKNGKLKEELLDECVRNYLKLVLETPAMKGRKKEYSVEAGKEAAYQAAKEGITLLKNDGVLPLKAGSRISFYGNKCLKMMDSCAGSAAVNTNLTTSLYECAADLTGKDHVNFEVTDERTDVIVAAVSANGQEGVDRQNMLMESEDRISLNKAIEASEHFGKPLIVCMNLAAPIQIIDWESKANAILSLFIPGMMGGKAAADILFGKVNPSGKLPLTFPRYYSDTPSSLNFPGYNSEVWYGEGIYVGYRYYEKKHMDVMYPFGYGLSYTSFEISKAEAPSGVNADKEDITVRVSVKNTGKMAGAETVQLYIHDPVSTLDKPVKELKTFQKVFLKAGESKEVTLTVSRQDLASYDVKLGMWAAEPGDYELLIGNSSANITSSVKVNVQCENPYAVGPKTDIIKVMSNRKALEIVEKESGIKVREVAGSYVVFQPLTPFETIWEACIKPALKVDEMKSGMMLRRIYSKWKNI